MMEIISEGGGGYRIKNWNLIIYIINITYKYNMIIKLNLIRIWGIILFLYGKFLISYNIYIISLLFIYIYIFFKLLFLKKQILIYIIYF